MVEVGEKVCRTCKYYGGQTQSCDYILMTKHSRLFTNGQRIDPKYCDKYVCEHRGVDPQAWIQSEFKMRKAERIKKRRRKESM